MKAIIQNTNQITCKKNSNIVVGACRADPPQHHSPDLWRVTLERIGKRR